MFKNAIIYVFSKLFTLTSEQLETALKEHPFRSTGKTELTSAGFVPPCPGSSQLVHQTGQNLFVCMQKEERLLPSFVVTEAVQEKVEQIEADQGRKIYKKERDQIKDEVTLDLLPRAFPRKTRISAWIDLKGRRVVVNTATFRKAEELTSLIRSALGSLPIVPPALKQPPANTMTHWLEHPETVPPMMTLGDGVLLKDLGEDGGEIRVKRQDIISDEIRNHINTGMQVAELDIHYNAACAFRLRDDLRLTGIKFTEALLEQSEALNAEDEASRFDADMALMCDTMAGLIDDQIVALGGFEEEEQA
ncbi:recombination-associated protein RdgC [Parendozoicomonas sp. Alg238-R29]|uniref:recombination-associated protein RdgC n=1 Tax=Parendozoicomonas sp. Alg238-R29 TaxID=2993446 RepID=UPI00248E3838|nr:recombination-associated protein RdgC [Parendozoicomonas sp. Alg238-R29]